MFDLLRPTGHISVSVPVWLPGMEEPPLGNSGRKMLEGFGTVWRGRPAALTLVLLPILIPRFAHGGSLAALMDETYSKTAYLAGEGLFTLSFNIKFKK